MTLCDIIYSPLRAGGKFASCWIGPYTILSKESDVNFRIKGTLRSGKQDIRIVHMDNLIKFEGDRRKLFARYNYSDLSDSVERSVYTDDPLLEHSVIAESASAHSGSGQAADTPFASAHSGSGQEPDTSSVSAQSGQQATTPSVSAQSGSGHVSVRAPRDIIPADCSDSDTDSLSQLAESVPHTIGPSRSHQFDRLPFDESVPDMGPEGVTEQSVTNSGYVSVRDSLKTRQFKEQPKKPPSLNIKSRPQREHKQTNWFGY